MKRDVVTILAVVFVVAFATYVIADGEDGQSTVGTSASYTAPAPNAVSTQGGNVTEVNVSADVSTGRWQGFYGNISGSLRLGDGSNTFYDWSSVSFQAVFASPDSAVDWTTIAGLSTTGDKEGKDTDYGFDSGAADSINLTMTGAACAAGTQISGAAGVTPYNSTGGTGSWTTCLAEDSGATVADTVFGTNIVEGGADAFNGQNVQYQLMVPVNATGQSYYFYLELS